MLWWANEVSLVECFFRFRFQLQIESRLGTLKPNLNPMAHDLDRSTMLKKVKAPHPMGATPSAFVDPERLPLEILLAEEVCLENGKEQKSDSDNDNEKEKLLQENLQLKREKKFWSDWALAMEKERNDLWDAQAQTVSLSSPLTRWSEKIYRPDKEGYAWKWYKTNCPCCRRPLEITTTMSSVEEEPQQSTGSPCSSCHAFVTALWGANAGYALGALVLGSRLRELSPHIDRVISPY